MTNLIIHANYLFKRLAFTLAEVLIVLGIIGIIAEMTIPTLQKEFQKKVTITQVQKVYTTLSQAIRQSEADNGPNSNWDWGVDTVNGSVRQSFDTYWGPYLKIMKYCDTYSDCGYDSSSPWLKPNSGSYGMVLVYAPMRTTVMLADGTLLLVKAYQGAAVAGDPNVPSHYIYVDINGSKKPNMFGKDVFEFVLDPQKGFMPYGYDQNDAMMAFSCNSTTGFGEYCAAKILRDGWQIKDDYPW